MITPRTTRLVRAADLRAFHRAILSCLPVDALAARDCAVLVPSRGAAEELRRTIENQTVESPAAHLTGRAAVVVLPDVVTRDEFYERLRERIPGAPPALTAFDREVLLRRSAHAARTGGAEPPFNLRPGLIEEILGLYDELRRRHKTVAQFDRLMTEKLEASAEYDRGAARLLQQTRFLVATFEHFESASAEVARCDEHRIRALALASPRPLYRRVVVTVPDQAADRRGLWAADFDLLARMPGLDALDVVATEGLLESGYYQRLHDDALPGIEDVRFEVAPSARPVLVVPDVPPGEELRRAFLCRDREEELAEFARALKTAPGRGTPLGRTAIVFQRPLPYLYLARQVFGDSRVPYQALDALPLAAEPFAVMVDLVFSAMAAGFTRAALVELLRCPHLEFAIDGRRLTAADVHALDRDLVKRKYLGGADRLSELSAFAREASPVGFGGTASSVAREASRAGFSATGALTSAAAAARELSEAAGAASAPAQIDGILAFIASREHLPALTDAWYAGHMRARAAVRSALERLRDAHAAYDPAPLSIVELSGAVRRWIEGQTFSPRRGNTGLALLDARAAPYADLDELRIVGLAESDWPERGARSIFYPSSLLAQLNWPADQDRLAAARAQFHDLLRLPRRCVSLSSFTLEDDSIVSPSPFLEEVDLAGLPVERLVTPVSAGTTPARVFVHEALAIEPTVLAAVLGAPAEWLALRAARTFEAARFRGTTDPREPAVYAVSRVERYLECPFKYFAAHVLTLPEERDEEAWMTPRERGHFVHEVFEDFFTHWQRESQGAITPANVAEALQVFDQVAERHLAALPEGDRALERTLLLGSAAAAGFGERAFAFEIEDEAAVVERLLEFQLEDTFTFATPEGPRRVRLRSKADRIDLLDDGTLRIVDYKLGRAPDRKRSLQLPIYGVCAQQALDGRRGRSWTVSRAGYIAFKEKTPFTELQHLDKALGDGQVKLLAAIDGIERGEFPVQPDEPFLCKWCAYPGVCRKDYVGDE